MNKDLIRAAAMFECENAMARHCYHHARGTHRDELEEIWHSDPARHHWKMMKSVMKSYVEGQENAAKAGYYRRMRTHPEAAIPRLPLSGGDLRPCAVHADYQGIRRRDGSPGFLVHPRLCGSYPPQRCVPFY